MHKKVFFHFSAVGFLLIGLFTLYFSPLLFSNSLIPSDGIIPAYFKVPQWSANIFSGYPLAADPIWQALNPLRFIVYKILHLDFNYFIISSYILTAFFTYAYVYQLTKQKMAAWISAIVFSFSGFAFFEIPNATTFMHTLCWMPLILLAFEKLKTNNSPGWILVAALAIALSIAGGFPQIAIAMLPVLLGYILLLSLQTEAKLKKTFFYLLVLFAGYLLALPIILPSFVLGLFSSRAHLNWAIFASVYVEYKKLLLFYFPYLWGGYYDIYAKIPVYDACGGIGNRGYLGFLSTTLACIGLFKTVSPLKSRAFFWAAVSLLSVVVALGPELTHFYTLLYHIPVFNNFRAPMRYLFIFAFGMSVLVGMGIQALQLGKIQNFRQKIIIAIGAMLFALSLLAMVIWQYPYLNAQALQHNHFPLPVLYKNPAVVIPALWIFLSLIGLFFVLRRPTSRKAILFITGILATELLYTAYFANWHPNHHVLTWNKEAFFNPPTYLLTLRDDLNSSNQRYLLMQFPTDKDSRYFFGDYPLYYNLSSAGGYTSLAIKKYLDLLNITESGVYAGFPDQFQNNQAINIAGIKYLLTIASDNRNSTWFKDRNHFKLRNKISDLLVYENTQALPRMWFTPEIMSLSDENTLQVIHSGKMPDGSRFDPRQTALSKLPFTAHFEKDKTAVATIEELKDTQLVIQTHTQKPQFMMVSDVYYPGWKAYIDGEKSNVYVVDYIYRGIVVPAGKHQVVFKFRPNYLYLSYVISGFTLLILIVFYLSRKFMRHCSL